MEKNPIIVGALIVMGEFMTNISGKTGGTINSHNKGGAYTKNFAMPSNPRSIYQIQARNRMTTYAQNWRNLTQVQRDAWNAAVGSFPYVNRVGKTCILSGIALYNKLNVNLALVGASALVLPPTPSGVAAVASLVGTNVSNVTTLTYTPSPVPVGSAWLVWATPGLSPGVKFNKNRFRLIGFLAAAATSPSVQTVAYNARFGAAPVGSRIYYGLQPINILTGETGIMLEATTIAV